MGDMMKSYRKIATRLFENTYEMCAFSESASKRCQLCSQLSQLACFLGLQSPVSDISALSQLIRFIADFSLDASDMYLKDCVVLDNTTRYVLASMSNVTHKFTFLVNEDSDISVNFRLPTTEYMYKVS